MVGYSTEFLRYVRILFSELDSSAAVSRNIFPTFVITRTNSCQTNRIHIAFMYLNPHVDRNGEGEIHFSSCGFREAETGGGSHDRSPLQLPKSRRGPLEGRPSQ